jgi:glycosyltransferase involved in cell wall biosynthesis
MGRIPREDVLRELSRSDFTVLIRSEEQRYAKAGFPTKFAESLATATPVISNATSDIADYLQDGVNGYLVSACSSEALTVALQKAICLTYEERVSMQQAARRTAEEYFDYARYKEPLKEFIEQK